MNGQCVKYRRRSGLERGGGVGGGGGGGGGEVSKGTAQQLRKETSNSNRSELRRAESHFFFVSEFKRKTKFTYINSSICMISSESINAGTCFIMYVSRHFA